MTRGVFLHREDSIYNDQPEAQYQFPSQYLSRAAQFVGDWIVYYEPRRGPTARGYYAIARVQSILPDPTLPRMYLALIEPGSYLQFERPVPFSGPDGHVERGVLSDDGKMTGRAQQAVRPISLEDFNRILDLGLPDEAPVLPRMDATPGALSGEVLHEEQAPFVMDVERQRVETYTSRVVRDRSSATSCSTRMTAAAPSPALNSSMVAGAQRYRPLILSPLSKMGPISSPMVLLCPGPPTGCLIEG